MKIDEKLRPMLYFLQVNTNKECSMKIINKILRTVFFPIYWIKEIREEAIAIRRLLGAKVIFDLENNSSVPGSKKEELLNVMLAYAPKYV